MKPNTLGLCLALLVVATVASLAAQQKPNIPDNTPPTPWVPTGGPYCVTPNVPIPDSPSPGVQSIVNIPGSFTLNDVNISVITTHTWVGDLVFSLAHGPTVTIIDRPGVPASAFGCSSNDINAILDDSAGSPVEDACSAVPPAINGTFSPNNPLSAFNGSNANGNWTLTVSDLAGGDTGTLNQWCVITDPVPVELMTFTLD